MLHRARDRLAAVLPSLLALALYGLGVNPWPVPGAYDDVVYHLGAASVANGTGFVVQGVVIRDWPPGLPILLSFLHRMGLGTFTAEKLFIVLCAAVGGAIARQLLVTRGDRLPTLTSVAFVLAPRAFFVGTMVYAEWPYVVFSLSLLAFLESRRPRPAWQIVLFGGLLLGCAALVRFAGVFLGAAVLASAVHAVLRERRLAAAFPAVGAAAFGGAIFLTGLAWARSFVTSAVPLATSENFGAQSYHSLHPHAVLAGVANLLLQTDSALRATHAPQGIAIAAGALLGLVIVAGAIVRLRREPERALVSEWYVLALLGFLSVYEGGDVLSMSRYCMPIFPLLASYAFEVVAWGHTRVSSRLGRAFVSTHTKELLARAVLALWLASAVAIDVMALVRGDASRTRGPLSPLVSRDVDAFYVGFWGDVLHAVRWVDEQPSGAVALFGRNDIMLSWFARTPVVKMASRPRYVIGSGEHVPRAEEYDLRATFGEAKVYVRRTDSASGADDAALR